MNKTKRRTDTREAVRALVRSVHGLTKEVSILRRYILEMRSQSPSGLAPLEDRSRYMPRPIPPQQSS